MMRHCTGVPAFRSEARISRSIQTKTGTERLIEKHISFAFVREKLKDSPGQLQRDGTALD